MPPSSWPYLDQPGVLAFAHRGAHGAEAGGLPENTMSAFEAAVGLGYRYVETDVHATSDGVLLAFHDKVLDRVTDRTGAIASLPWDEVRKAKVGGTEPIPLLEDILGTWPDVRVNIDVKEESAIPVLADTLKRTNSVGRVCVGSFSDRRISRVRRLVGPELCTSVGPVATARVWASARRVPTGRVDAACAQVPVRQGRITVVDSRFVDTAHRAGLQVHVWTIDDTAEMERLLDLGVDGLMTDRPVTLREVLRRRGVWD